MAVLQLCFLQKISCSAMHKAALQTLISGVCYIWAACSAFVVFHWPAHLFSHCFTRKQWEKQSKKQNRKTLKI